LPGGPTLPARQERRDRPASRKHCYAMPSGRRESPPTCSWRGREVEWPQPWECLHAYRVPEGKLISFGSLQLAVYSKLPENVTEEQVTGRATGGGRPPPRGERRGRGQCVRGNCPVRRLDPEVRQRLQLTNPGIPRAGEIGPRGGAPHSCRYRAHKFHESPAHRRVAHARSSDQGWSARQ